jgi:hypothetical protein
MSVCVRVENVVVIRRSHFLIRHIIQVFCDIFFHTSLLLTTRNLILLSMNYDDSGITPFSGDGDHLEDRGYYLLVSFGPASVVYICFRLLADLFSFTQVSWAVFLQHLFYLWTIVDISAVAMILCSVLCILFFDDFPNDMSVYFSFQAFTVGVLWLKVIGFLQLLNCRLATYIVSIFQVSQRERVIGVRATISRIP